MPRKYPYHPAWDGGKSSELMLKCFDLCKRRYKTVTNLGIYANRPVRNPAAEGELSVHATGFALDLGYKDEAQARIIWDFFVLNSKVLKTAEVHWYEYGRNKGKFGAGYRCSRGEGRAGVRVYNTAAESAGRGGKYLHIELEDQDVDEFEANFRALKNS